VEPPIVTEPVIEPLTPPPGPAPVPSAGFNYIPYLIAGVVALGVVSYLKYGRKK
jgi:hypothetical protein